MVEMQTPCVTLPTPCLKKGVRMSLLTCVPTVNVGTTMAGWGAAMQCRSHDDMVQIFSLLDISASVLAILMLISFKNLLEIHEPAREDPSLQA